MQNTVTNSYRHMSFWPCPNGSHQNSHRYTLPGLLHSVHFHIRSECHILLLAIPQSCLGNLRRENVANECIQELLELYFQYPSGLLISSYSFYNKDLLCLQTNAYCKSASIKLMLGLQYTVRLV